MTAPSLRAARPEDIDAVVPLHVAVWRGIDPGPIWRSSNIIYAWDDLSFFG
jgi:hypothetical protein